MNKFESRWISINDSDKSCLLTNASLCIYYVDPEIVTHKLKITPTLWQKIGVSSALPSGKKKIGTVNSWVLDSDRHISSKDLRTHLNWLLDQIMPLKNQILELQQIPGTKMTIRCIWFSAEGVGGPTLWPEQMERMAELNLECNISFTDYSEDNNKDTIVQNNDSMS